MARLASFPGDARRVSDRDKDVRSAIEVLAAAEDRLIVNAVCSGGKSGFRFLSKVRTVDARLATRELEDAMAKLRSKVDPTTARAAQATENVWREVADEFELLKSGE